MVKIGYCLERVEQYVSAPLRCFKCQKFGYHRDTCRGWQTCAKCRVKEPNHKEGECLKLIRCPNCQQDHPAYTKSCNIYWKEKEIIEVKHKRNESFLEARQIVGSYMSETSCASVTRRAEISNQDNEYRALINKLINLDQSEWPKFQADLKNIHTNSIQQTSRLEVPAQTNKSFDKIKEDKKFTKTIAQTQTTPPKNKTCTDHQSVLLLLKLTTSAKITLQTLNQTMIKQNVPHNLKETIPQLHPHGNI